MQIKSHQPLAVYLLEGELQQARVWLEHIIRCTHESDAAYLLQLCKATLSCLRRALPYSAGALLAGHLPLLVRGMWFEEWRRDETQVSCSTITEFVACVRPFLHAHYADAVIEEDVLSVLRAFFQTYPATVEVARKHLPTELIYENQVEN